MEYGRGMRLRRRCRPAARCLFYLAFLLIPLPGLAGAEDAARQMWTPASLVIDVESVAEAPVLVYLEGAHAQPDAAKSGWIYNETFQFKPYFQVLALGGTVTVVNKDPTLHNTHLIHSSTLFNVAAPLPDIPIRRTLSMAGVFSVRCDLHPTMRAWLFVAENPHYAVLQSGGSYRIDGFPAGEHRVHVWDAQSGDRLRLIHFAPGEIRHVSLDELREAGRAPAPLDIVRQTQWSGYWLLGAGLLIGAILAAVLLWRRRAIPERPSLYRIQWDRYQ